MIGEIWSSFRSLPAWVQVWVAFWLVPINLLGFVFLPHPLALLAGGLGALGMAPNLAIILWERGFSKAMAFPHLPTWTLLVVLLAIALTGPGAPGGLFGVFLWTLLITDATSLVFDYRDAWLWSRGDRAVARASRS